MTLFLDLRTRGVGGDIADPPRLREGNGLVADVDFEPRRAQFLNETAAGREVVFATHGFNVSRQAGAHSLAGLERDLHLGDAFVFVGVLWPGDFWIPVINYPAEADDAVRCGRLLASFIDTELTRVGGVSLVSHSLGGRLVLEAAKRLARPAREVCLLAAAVDDDCLSKRQYGDARENAGRISVLASRKDLVLRVAYPAGDFLSDIFYDDDSPARKALGYHGPRPKHLEHVLHAQIPPGKGPDEYGHGDYLPSSNLAKPNPRADRPVRFVAEALQGLPHGWP